MTEPRRRELTLDSVQEVLAEVERLASQRVTTTGKHSFPEIVRHLAITYDMMTGRIAVPKPPLFLRLIVPLIRSSIFKGPVKPGIQLPAAAEAAFWPPTDISIEDALTRLKESAAYYQQHGPLREHPIFGKSTPEQQDRLACRHAAMHLSFVHPD